MSESFESRPDFSHVLDAFPCFQEHWPQDPETRARILREYLPDEPEIGTKKGLDVDMQIYVYHMYCWWGSGDIRSSDGLVVRVHVRYLCQNRPKTGGEHPPRPPGSSSSPQIFPAA